LAKAKELVLTGRRLSADEALAMGLVNYVSVDYTAAYEKSLELAREMNKKGPLGIRWAKEAVNGSLDMGIDDGLLLEEKCYGNIVATKDRIEGLKAFVEKRDPVYKGE
jgi:methylglutaconyl-CoA hydratase